MPPGNGRRLLFQAEALRYTRCPRSPRARKLYCAEEQGARLSHARTGDRPPVRPQFLFMRPRNGGLAVPIYVGVAQGPRRQGSTKWNHSKD
jgi:hypothetical protein